MQIVAEKISYTYNEKSPFASQALKEVSLTIDEGEFFGIIGHTGSGKSTFIQHLNGLIKISKKVVKQGAKLKIGDYDLTSKKCNFLELRSKVGMVFQYPEYQLFAETIFEDVAFGFKNFNKKATQEEIESQVKTALELVGLDYKKYKDKSPFELSGGQKRRVAIAGVIVTKPEILILDEPVAGLDPIGKREMFALLHKLKEKVCKTIILVSHDMDDVAENCTRVAVFTDGKIDMVYPCSELFKHSERLLNLGLDIPETAKCVQYLKTDGLEIETDFSAKDFVAKILALYKKEN